MPRTMTMAREMAHAPGLSGTTLETLPPGSPTARGTPATRTRPVNASVAAAARTVATRLVRSKPRNGTRAVAGAWSVAVAAVISGSLDLGFGTLGAFIPLPNSDRPNRHA